MRRPADNSPARPSQTPVGKLSITRESRDTDSATTSSPPPVRPSSYLPRRGSGGGGARDHGWR